MSDLDRWLDISRECKYLPENDLKQLCDLVCDLLLEESNIQPVSTPVTVCGDIHGQVRGDFINDNIMHDTFCVFIERKKNMIFNDIFMYFHIEKIKNENVVKIH